MHTLTFVLNPVNTVQETIEEEAILNELRHADYVTGLPLQDTHFDILTTELAARFGNENLTADKNARTITVNRAGIIRYFESLRALIKKTVDLAMDKPIEDFIHMRGESDWYAVKTMLDDHFATQFYFDGYCCGSMTVFAHSLYVWMGYEMTDDVTLELTQVFDCHF